MSWNYTSCITTFLFVFAKEIERLVVCVYMSNITQKLLVEFQPFCIWVHIDSRTKFLLLEPHIQAWRHWNQILCETSKTDQEVIERGKLANVA